MEYELIIGDCVSTMNAMTNRVDAIITDPPYEIALKDWDSTGVAHDVATWEAAYQRLKPGGYLLAFSAVRTQHRLTTAIEKAGFEIRDVIVWHYATGMPKGMDIGKAFDKRLQRTTNEWAGWNTTLKPSYEPIVIARKPFSGSLVDNLFEHRTGAINIDACRVGSEERETATGGMANQTTTVFGQYPNTVVERYKTTMGRWPSNTITTDIEEDWSKFFFVAKPSPKERGKANFHPTLKPLKLMQHLCKLVTPPGGTILDPFTGSGTTGVAALNCGFNFVGIELSPCYAAIAEARLEASKRGFSQSL